MRVAALYDVHGCRVALEATLAEVAREHVDAIVFGGDLFLGPQPAETAELWFARSRPCSSVATATGSRTTGLAPSSTTRRSRGRRGGR